uniref:Uncharacterized protein n=1 Tax=Lygus hesperus TaxID=30085 RepID=A0A0A9YHN1_LYGHE
MVESLLSSNNTQDHLLQQRLVCFINSVSARMDGGAGKHICNGHSRKCNKNSSNFFAMYKSNDDNNDDDDEDNDDEEEDDEYEQIDGDYRHAHHGIECNSRYSSGACDEVNRSTTNDTSSTA